VVDVRKDYPRITRAGGELLVVTMGDVRQTAAFRDKLEAGVVFLADPQRKAYAAYGLDRGTLWQVAGPRVWLPSIRALARGGAGKAVGDIWQMPGAFVVDRQGRIRYAHYPANQADRPDHDRIVRTLESLGE
jgi:peroxiredoxin